MTPMQIVSLLLALSIALNIAISVGLIARRTGIGTADAVLTAADAGATSLSLYFAAVAAHH